MMPSSVMKAVTISRTFTLTTTTAAMVRDALGLRGGHRVGIGPSHP